MKIAEIGNIIEFKSTGTKGNICKGLVIEVKENVVIVDVRNDPFFQKEGLERTVVNHKNYKIIGNSDSAEAINPVKTYQAPPTPVNKGASAKPMAKRDKLTVERYVQHKKEKLIDSKIWELYDYPKSSAEKWKRDNAQQIDQALAEMRLAQKAETMTKEAAATAVGNEPAWLNADTPFPIETPEPPKECVKCKDRDKEMQQLLNQLQVEREMNAMRQEMIASLEKDVQALKTSEMLFKGNQSNELVIENADLQEKLKTMELVCDEARAMANEYKMRCQHLQKELLLISELDGRDNETANIYNDQSDMFKNYELFLLQQRILQLKTQD